MKNRKSIFVLGMLMMCGWALTCCTKNNDKTIVLIGTEYYIDDILSVVPDSLQTSFFAEFGSVPEGAVPPDVEGSYVMAPKQRVSSHGVVWPLQTVEPNMYLRFTNQHNGIVKMDLNEATETVTDTVFVGGVGNAFVVYFIEDKSYDIELGGQIYHAKVKRGIVMKGQVTEEGLKDFRYATIIMKSEDDSNGLIAQYPIGSYFIYKDGDGLAKREEW